jgi:hypothetical protein
MSDSEEEEEAGWIAVAVLELEIPQADGACFVRFRLGAPCDCGCGYDSCYLQCLDKDQKLLSGSIRPDKWDDGALCVQFYMMDWVLTENTKKEMHAFYAKTFPERIRSDYSNIAELNV